jgi:hypothetical protein
MSGLLKPKNHFTSAIGSGLLENIDADEVTSMEKEDIPAFGTGRPAEYYLVFILKGNVIPRKVKFLTSAARNTSFTAYRTLNSVAVV